MACEISICQGERVIIRLEAVPLTNIEEIKTLFWGLDEKYPEEQGYELHIRRSPGFMPDIPRSVFRKACQSDDWRDVINCYVREDEFAAFCQSVTLMPLDVAYYHIDNLYDHKGLTVVRCYQDVMAIFELSKDRKVFQIYGHSDFESDDLLSVERELYRLYIKSYDRFTYPAE
ncbi:hypothetical protein [Puia dinghuensis]|uniref:Uncharacterized protein n=1 Tax=Puia dinghuensis TaxID=1792502 RepID=A0A8J2UBA5_9BACT|nr:hypothetical protein [Puia dinghuensis]GGA92809.1 hypothetical protein GCM10011511_15270 [Puia dinghuensis]